MAERPIPPKPKQKRSAKPSDEKPKLGRPTIYSEELAKEICERMVRPESIRTICLDSHMPARSTIALWMTNDAHFRSMIVLAREMQAEALADEMLEIADNASGDYVMKDGKLVPNWESVQRAKLKCDTRRWYAAKLAPKRFGDKVEVSADPDVPQSNQTTDAERAKALALLFARIKIKEETKNLGDRLPSADLPDRFQKPLNISH